MNGQCGEEFKPYTSGCENCSAYDRCMKQYKDIAPGDNYPLKPFEQEIKNNKEKFKRYRPIVEAEVLMFKSQLSSLTADDFIRILELTND
jgi:hypothetical protein